MSLFEVITDHYGPKTAESYDQLADQLFWGYPETLSAMAAELVFGRRTDVDMPTRLDRILDAGIGTGNLSQAVLKTCERAFRFRRHQEDHLGRNSIFIQGYDGSSAMIDRARLKLKNFENIQLDFQIGRLESLGTVFGGQEFDVVMTTFSLHHLSGPDKQKFMREAHRVLRPGGLLVVGDKMTSADSKTDAQYHAVMGSLFPTLFEAEGRGPKYSEILNEIQRQFDEDGDRPSSVAEHVTWMTEAGFVGVRVPFLSFGNAIVSGQK